MFINKPLNTSQVKNHKLLIIFKIFTLYVSCSDNEVSTEKITISGEISLAETIETNQPINLTIFHAISGIGFQEHPLYEIESFTSDQLTFQHTFDYDAKGNRGLLVYAWVDLDGDGINCTPVSRGTLPVLLSMKNFQKPTRSSRLELRHPVWVRIGFILANNI
ncbi:MAG: hypothetical protein Ct9H300mP4_16440 [Gammaproteobacteria bacterium]|nr:MAG: hypothetical protein Ct9H300mP4_16440 [Gammaproteobacteria bacterium]